jgi:antitoxin PrlF
MMFASDDAMKEIDSTVTGKGRVTIPAEIRRHLGVGEGDKITFVVEDQGTVQVKASRYPTIASLRGAAGSLYQPLSWKEMRRIAHEDRPVARSSPDVG